MPHDKDSVLHVSEAEFARLQAQRAKQAQALHELMQQAAKDAPKRD